MHGKRKLGLFLLAATVFVGAEWATYKSVPSANTDADHFDVLIVLGCPARQDGTASPEQRERVLEGVREYKRGRAGHIIFTGGAAHNRYVEGIVMAALAERYGVPGSAMVVEEAAQNTVQNIFYSRRIMAERGWKSAEVVSSPSHLPRTALILEHYTGSLDFEWRTDAAKWPREYGWASIAGAYAYEATGTTVFRWFGFRKSRFLPS